MFKLGFTWCMSANSSPKSIYLSGELIQLHELYAYILIIIYIVIAICTILLESVEIPLCEVL